MLGVFGGLNEQMPSIHENFKTMFYFSLLKLYIVFFLNVANLKCVSTEAIEYCSVMPSSQL